MDDGTRLIAEYRAEVTAAAGTFFTWKNFHNLAAGNADFHRAVNANALSWNYILHSLQQSFVITLGRIFDKDKRSLTLIRFLTECKKHPEYFSKAALEQRRLASASGARPDWLDEYLKEVYEPETADFDALLVTARPHDDAYRNTIEPIRHKFVAHRDFVALETKGAIFAGTTIGDIEITLTFLYQVLRVVEELHSNGRLTLLGDHTLREEDYVRQDLEKLMVKLAKR